MTFAKKVISFYSSLNITSSLPAFCRVMNPYHEQGIKKTVNAFYQNYYSDRRRRLFLFGINPGRHGAGITGIPFTDPIRLSKVCGISHHLAGKPELSSVFIYEVIQSYGGIRKFCSDFYITSVSPLGFIRDGKNMNYYDDKNLQSSLQDFIVTNIRKQKAFGTTDRSCMCLGEGKNYEFLSALNEKEVFFSEIIPLPHPRWIMQYKRKKMDGYVKEYVSALYKQRQLMDE